MSRDFQEINFVGSTWFKAMAWITEVGVRDVLIKTVVLMEIIVIKVFAEPLPKIGQVVVWIVILRYS